MKSDKRKSPRKPLRYAAHIVLDDGSRKSCWLSDISDVGARIDVDDADGLSETFLLLLAGSNGPRRNCTVIWRENGQVGVAFNRDAAAARSVAGPRPSAPPLAPDQSADATSTQATSAPAAADADKDGA